jgi:hypothetical protein
MADMAGVIGRFHHVEMALFSWLGHSAVSLGSPEEVVWASGASLRAAWRAAQLEPLLPVSAGLVDADAARVPAGSAVATSLQDLESFVPPGAPGSALRLASAWYAALLDAYRFRLEWLAPAPDGALERVLHRLVTDLGVERERSEASALSW